MARSVPEAAKAAPKTTRRGARVFDGSGMGRITFAFAPAKAVATLHYLAEIMSTPMRIEHPLLRLKGVMAVLWIADVRHFQAAQRPITGTRWCAYPQGPVPIDILDLISGNPLWLAELPETEYMAPFEVRGDCIARNLRVRFAHDPKKLLSTAERETLKKAVATGKGIKRNKSQTVLRGEAYRQTPLYEVIPWELMLAPRMRTGDFIARLAATARDTAL